MKIDKLIDYYEKRRIELYDEKELLLADEYDYSCSFNIIQAKYDEVCLVLDNLKQIN